MLFDRSSYETVLCLGLILDEQGQKMSKSRGNIVVPWEVLDRHGADVFRWYYFTSKQPWDGYRFSVDTIGESVRQFMLTLWNTYSFWVLYGQHLPDWGLTFLCLETHQFYASPAFQQAVQDFALNHGLCLVDWRCLCIVPTDSSQKLKEWFTLNT